MERVAVSAAAVIAEQEVVALLPYGMVQADQN